MHTGESAINRGLAKRLKDLEKERERRNRAAREDDLQFSLDFLSTSRKVFRMIDKDDSGTLEKQEVIDAVSADKKVINFLVNCGETAFWGHCPQKAYLSGSDFPIGKDHAQTEAHFTPID